MAKIHYRDSGVAHDVLGIDTSTTLAHHPKRGATWDGMVVEEVLGEVRTPQAHFWTTHGCAELDVLLARRVGGSVASRNAATPRP